MDRIILASASERRKELLSQLIGNHFEVCVSSYDESSVADLSPVELVMHHSSQKAHDVAGKFTEGIIISADTVIVLGNKVLGKPDNEKHAASMLKIISGQKVRAITGLTLIDAKTGKESTGYEQTYVWIREIPDEMIKEYIATGEPSGKAGAFAIQGKGSILVERIEGDFFNIVGLPLFRLAQMFEHFGIDVLRL